MTSDVGALTRPPPPPSRHSRKLVKISQMLVKSGEEILRITDLEESLKTFLKTVTLVV